MKFPIAVVAAIVSLAGVCVADTSGVECSITVDADKVRFPVAPDMWGIFFEDIDLSLDGGIYAEMVRNRSFEEGNLGREQNEPLAWWDPVGAAYLSAVICCHCAGSLLPADPGINRRCCRPQRNRSAGR